MLSFQDYLSESRIAALRREAVARLTASGRTLEDVVEEILSRSQLQNEFFGGFLSRLGSAWRAFWHGENDDKMFSASDVQTYVDDLKAKHDQEIAGLMAQIKKGGGVKDVENALREILKTAGGAYYDVTKQIREKSLKEGEGKPDGVLHKFAAVVSKLQDLSQDSRIPNDQRLAGIQQAEAELQQINAEAQKLTTAPDPADQQEAKRVIAHLNDEKFKALMAAMDKIKKQVGDYLEKSSDPSGRKSPEDGYEKRSRMGAGGGAAQPLPNDLGGVYKAVMRMSNEDKAASLDAWWKAMPPDQQQQVHTALNMGSLSLERVTGRLLMTFVKNAGDAGKI